MSSKEEGRPLSPSSAAVTTTNAATPHSNNNSIVARCLTCFNLTAVGGLSVAVIFLFIQMQLVTVRVAQQSSQIQKIINQMSSQQAQTEDLNEKVAQEHDLTILHMAGTFTLLTCLITMFHMSSHLRNFHEPFVQRKILSILWMSPIYAVTSFLSLLWPPMEGYLSIIKDFYEAYVIYMFLSFLIAVLGRGERQQVVNVLAKHADHLKSPAKCFGPFYHPPPDEGPHAKAQAILMECQILAMQFVFCRPITSIVAFVVTTLSEMNEKQVTSGSDELDGTDAAPASSGWSYFASPLFWIAMVQNVSVFLAFRGMLKFYHVVREDLMWCQPFSKFLAIKGVVFMTFWQGLAIAIIVNFHQGGGQWGNVNGDDDDTMSPRDQAIMVQNILICLEMLFFSIAHWCVFPTDEWEPGYRPREYAKPGIGIKDFVDDISYIAESRKLSSRHSRLRNEVEHSNGNHRDEASTSALVPEEDDDDIADFA